MEFVAFHQPNKRRKSNGCMLLFQIDGLIDGRMDCWLDVSSWLDCVFLLSSVKGVSLFISMFGRGI